MEDVKEEERSAQLYVSVHGGLDHTFLKRGGELSPHKVVLNSTRPLNTNTHPLTFPRGSGHHKITWIAFIWPLSTARSHFHFSDDWSLLEMSVGERLCSRVSDRPAPPLAAFGRQGQIIAHFLGRSYDLHIYFGIFCTGCICDIQIHGIWGIQLHLYLKPTKFYITTLVAFCFRKAAPSWVFVDYPGEAGVESKLSGDKKLFLFLPPAPQPVVRIQRWGGNLPPGFVFAQQSCNFSSQDVHRLASFKISEYLHKFVQLFGGVKKKNKFTSSLPLLYM